jgi:hypothetical protein
MDGLLRHSLAHSTVYKDIDTPQKIVIILNKIKNSALSLLVV